MDKNVKEKSLIIRNNQNIVKISFNHAIRQSFNSNTPKTSQIYNCDII